MSQHYWSDPPELKPWSGRIFKVSFLNEGQPEPNSSLKAACILAATCTQGAVFVPLGREVGWCPFPSPSTCLLYRLYRGSSLLKNPQLWTHAWQFLCFPPLGLDRIVSVSGLPPGTSTKRFSSWMWGQLPSLSQSHLLHSWGCCTGLAANPALAWNCIAMQL